MIKVPAYYYSQSGIDVTLPHPGLGIKGWGKTDIPIDPKRTAVVVMHCWKLLPYEQFPECYQIVEYNSRVNKIYTERLKPFVEEVRKSGTRVIHIAAGFEPELQKFAGYHRMLEKYPPVHREQIVCSPEHEQLRLQRRLLNLASDKTFCDRIEESYNHYCFEIKPLDHEDVVFAENQLFSLCRDEGIDHLIYVGFAVNACLVSSACGYIDMTRRGIMCSIVGDLTTAVESKETCQEQLNRQIGLWQFAVWGGFVFLSEDLKEHLLKE